MSPKPISEQIVELGREIREELKEDHSKIKIYEDKKALEEYAEEIGDGKIRIHYPEEITDDSLSKESLENNAPKETTCEKLTIEEMIEIGGVLLENLKKQTASIHIYEDEALLDEFLERLESGEVEIIPHGNNSQIKDPLEYYGTNDIMKEISKIVDRDFNKLVIRLDESTIED